MKKTKVLLVLNSDFGRRETMGYRAFQIYQKNSGNIAIYARSNKSNIDTSSINTPGVLYRVFSRMVRLLMLSFGENKITSAFKKIENSVFNHLAKKHIRQCEIVHFFCHSITLIQGAKCLGKKVIIEAFTHPAYIKYMNKKGMTLESEEYESDTPSVKCYEIVDNIISPSDWTTKTLLHSGLPREKIKQIEYGVHKQKIKTYKKSGTFKVMFAGGVKRTKGIFELCKAVSCFNEDEVELHIYGVKYKSVSQELKLITDKQKNIIFHGFNKDIISEYYKYDVYIFPSYFEGSSKTIFEAMSVGLPVIATENSGSIVRHGVDGYIVPVCNADLIVKYLKLFLKDIQLLERMGTKAKFYSEEYTWEKYSQSVNRYYTQVGKG
jgi:glycosyltransferase involved in cell wall biosynthesis